MSKNKSFSSTPDSLHCRNLVRIFHQSPWPPYPIESISPDLRGCQWTLIGDFLQHLLPAAVGQTNPAQTLSNHCLLLFSCLTDTIFADCPLLWTPPPQHTHHQHTESAKVEQFTELLVRLRPVPTFLHHQDTHHDQRAIKEDPHIISKLRSDHTGACFCDGVRFNSNDGHPASRNRRSDNNAKTLKCQASDDSVPFAFWELREPINLWSQRTPWLFFDSHE